MMTPPHSAPPDASDKPAAPLKPWHYLVLLLPYVGLLVPSLYARWFPELFGIPFFYVYQFAWIFLSVAITAIVYRRITR